MKYLLKTPYQCLVKSQSQSVELDTNDTLECDEEQVLYIYPLTAEQIPFCINLSNRTDNDKYSFLKHNGQIIIYLEKPEKFDVYKKEDLLFSGKHCHINISKNRLSFETDKQKINCLTDKSKFPPKVFKQKNFACVLLEHDFFGYCMQNERLTHLHADTISLDKNILTTTKKYVDSDQREKVCQYEIGEEITLKEQQIIKSQSRSFEEENLVSYKFLESVKASDYQNSETYLSPTLSGKIGEEQIKNFFGFLSDFLPLSSNEFIAISGNEKKYVTFDLQNGKICDISIDEL